MSNRSVVAFVAVLLAAAALTAQVTVPYPNFTVGTIADPAQVNANFAALSSNALNRTGGTLTGPINLNGQTLSGSVTFSTPIGIASGGTNSSATATAGGVGYGTGTAHAYTAAGSAGQVLTSNGAGAPSWGTPGVLTLLKANSGTSTAAGATDVDTVAITGLTAKDTLLIYYTMETIAQDTANPVFRSVTDTTTIMATHGSNTLTVAQALQMGEARIMVPQSSSSRYIGLTRELDVANASRTNVTDTTLATAFTASWTLAFRHAGVTAGGTFKWTWSVYRVAGQ